MFSKSKHIIDRQRTDKNMKFRDRIARFMQGRYGGDQLSRFLSWVAIVPLLLSMFLQKVWNGGLSSALWLIAVVALIYGTFRMFSKNIYQRQKENDWYLGWSNRINGWFRNKKQQFKDRKEYKYFRCPTCKATLRVPRHKGKVQITCKKCGNRFTGNT